ARGGEGGDRLALEGRLRRAEPRQVPALRPLPVHQDRRGQRRHRPRGDGLEDRRGAALLPDVARALRGGGVSDDRLRLRRADHQRASTGVRSRVEPADPTPDGRLRRLIQVGHVDFIAQPVSELKRAADFYGGTLGLMRNPASGDRWAEYETGNLTIALSMYGGTIRLPAEGGEAARGPPAGGGPGVH